MWRCSGCRDLETERYRVTDGPSPMRHSAPRAETTVTAAHGQLTVSGCGDTVVVMSLGIPPPPGSPAGLEADARLRLGFGANGLPVVAGGARWLLANHSRRRGYGRGKLHISSGTIVFVPSWLTRKRTKLDRFPHAGSDIVLTRARLGLPWARSFLILTNDQSYLRLALPAFRLRELRRVLASSGLEDIQEVTAWTAPRLPPHTRTRQ
jgi:hypothetical protein